MARDNFFSLLTIKAQPPQGHFITLARKKTVNMCLQNEHIKREKEKETKEKTFTRLASKLLGLRILGFGNILSGNRNCRKSCNWRITSNPLIARFA